MDDHSFQKYTSHLRSKKLWMGKLRATKQCEIETLLGTPTELSIEKKFKNSIVM